MNVLGNLTELTVQALDDIGRVYDFPDLCGICGPGRKFCVKTDKHQPRKREQNKGLPKLGTAQLDSASPPEFRNGRRYGNVIKALYVASATSFYHTAIYGDGWDYDISKVNIPVFLAAGTGAWDAGTAASKDQVNDDKNGIAQGICPLWSLQENYSLLPETVDKVIARKKNVDHGDSHLQFDGYMTAWFMWQLQGDEEAAKAFVGDAAEILTNPLYQDQQTAIK